MERSALRRYSGESLADDGARLPDRRYVRRRLRLVVGAQYSSSQVDDGTKDLTHAEARRRGGEDEEVPKAAYIRDASKHRILATAKEFFLLRQDIEPLREESGALTEGFSPPLGGELASERRSRDSARGKISSRRGSKSSRRGSKSSRGGSGPSRGPFSSFARAFD